MELKVKAIFVTVISLNVCLMLILLIFCWDVFNSLQHNAR